MQISPNRDWNFPAWVDSLGEICIDFQCPVKSWNIMNVQHLWKSSLHIRFGCALSSSALLYNGEHLQLCCCGSFCARCFVLVALPLCSARLARATAVVLYTSLTSPAYGTSLIRLQMQRNHTSLRFPTYTASKFWNSAYLMSIFFQLIIRFFVFKLIWHCFSLSKYSIFLTPLTVVLDRVTHSYKKEECGEQLRDLGLHSIQGF